MPTSVKAARLLACPRVGIRSPGLPPAGDTRPPPTATWAPLSSRLPRTSPGVARFAESSQISLAGIVSEVFEQPPDAATSGVTREFTE